MLPDLFEKTKPIIAMAHLGPLPGAPGYDADGGIDALTEAVAADIEKLQEGGVDAIMFGNEGDRPYLLKASPESLAAMSVIVARLTPMLRVPFGVNYLWDPYATVALAVATGAAFAREIFTGVYASDMGLWQPDCAGALRLRASLGRPDLKLLFNINAEFAAALDYPADRAARRQRCVLVACRRHLRVGADDRPGQSSSRTCRRSRRRFPTGRCSPTPASTSTTSPPFSRWPTAA